MAIKIFFTPAPRDNKNSYGRFLNISVRRCRHTVYFLFLAAVCILFGWETPSSRAFIFESLERGRRCSSFRACFLYARTSFFPWHAETSTTLYANIQSDYICFLFGFLLRLPGSFFSFSLLFFLFFSLTVVLESGDSSQVKNYKNIKSNRTCRSIQKHNWRFSIKAQTLPVKNFIFYWERERETHRLHSKGLVCILHFAPFPSHVCVPLNVGEIFQYWGRGKHARMFMRRGSERTSSSFEGKAFLKPYFTVFPRIPYAKYATGRSFYHKVPPKIWINSVSTNLFFCEIKKS